MATLEIFCFIQANYSYWFEHILYFFVILTCSTHGTITRTGIRCKKILWYTRDSACKWLIVEKAKIFQSYVKQF